MQNTHNVQENNEFIYVQDACNSLFAKKKNEFKKKNQPKNEKGTGPYQPTNKHIDFRPLSLVHVRRNRLFVLLE
jgi:hypothetical protein